MPRLPLALGMPPILCHEQALPRGDAKSCSATGAQLPAQNRASLALPARELRQRKFSGHAGVRIDPAPASLAAAGLRRSSRQWRRRRWAQQLEQQALAQGAESASAGRSRSGLGHAPRLTGGGTSRRPASDAAAPRPFPRHTQPGSAPSGLAFLPQGCHKTEMVAVSTLASWVLVIRSRGQAWQPAAAAAEWPEMAWQAAGDAEGTRHAAGMARLAAHLSNPPFHSLCPSSAPPFLSPLPSTALSLPQPSPSGASSSMALAPPSCSALSCPPCR